MSTESFLLVVRLGVSLSLVFGLMWVAARVLRGRAAALGRTRLDHLEVVERKPLGKGSSIAIVRVGDEFLTVGVTDSQVSLLGAADLPADATRPVPAAPATATPVTSTPVTATPLNVAPETAPARRSVLDTLRDKTVRQLPG